MPKKILEKDIQERFLDNLLTQTDEVENSSVAVYQKLVYMRYHEVIKNSFPLFIDLVDEKTLVSSIKAFMKDTPETPFVWQMANDYRKFVKKNKLFDDKKYIYELLYYDWIEIELYMKEYKEKKKKKFSYKNSYKLSKSARIKRFKYDLINKDFASKRENFLVIYYDFETDDIVYREINPIIYYLLKSLNKKQTIGNTLKKLCKENDIDFKEAKEALIEPLSELNSNGVFFFNQYK
ncbi:putative DNA-binding domain-containing protein [Halarcobacter sp.]|uniref:HvfC family peptide modification chaperone n=1 Tax=Halarcobacter sp. TaxID=2321133 RepID=UPI003B000D4B